MAQLTLLDTVILGDSTRVRQLVLDGWDVNSPDEYNRTYLHWAAQGNNADVIKLLLECRADPSVRTSAGVCPLHIAIYCGHREAVRLLVAAGARLSEPDTYPFDRHAAHWAAKSGDMELVKILVEKAEVPLSYVDVAGRTPAQLAADLGHVKIARYLFLKSGSPMPDSVAMSLEDDKNDNDDNDGGDEDEPAADVAMGGVGHASQKQSNEASAIRKVKKLGRKRQESNNNKKVNGTSTMSNSDDEPPLPAKRISSRSGRAVVEDSSDEDDDDNQSFVKTSQRKDSNKTRAAAKEKNRTSKAARKNADEWLPGHGDIQRSAKSSKSTNKKPRVVKGGKEEAEKSASAPSKKRRKAVRLDIYNELFKNDVDDDLSFAGKIPKKKRRTEGWSTERSK